MACCQVDTMIVQAIGLLDDLDKELNTYAMRVREWFGWHFPEMTKIVSDNITYAKVVRARARVRAPPLPPTDDAQSCPGRQYPAVQRGMTSRVQGEAVQRCASEPGMAAALMQHRAVWRPSRAAVPDQATARVCCR